MIKVWKNFVTGRRRWVLIAMLLFIIIQIGMGFTIKPWWLGGSVAIFLWVFFVPFFFYLLERNRRKNS